MWFFVALLGVLVIILWVRTSRLKREIAGLWTLVQRPVSVPETQPKPAAAPTPVPAPVPTPIVVAVPPPPPPPQAPEPAGPTFGERVRKLLDV